MRAAASVAVVAAVITVALSSAHLSSLRRMPISARQQLYLTIAWMPIVFGVSACVSLFGPRSSVMWWLLRSQYEAIALSTFGTLLFLLLVVTAAPNASAAPPAFVGTSIIQLLASEGAQKHFATPPLCCLCTPCWPVFHLGARHLLAVYYLLQQFVLLTPALAVVSMWAAIALQPTTAHSVCAACLLLKKASTFLALWGLFALYKSSHDVLHHWNTTKKFIALKAVLILELLQEHIIAHLVLHAEDHAQAGELEDDYSRLPPSPPALDARAVSMLDEFNSLLPPISQQEHEGACLHGHQLVSFWGCWALTVECIAMALLIRKAFPPHELETKFAAEQQGLLIELELLHHWNSEDLRVTKAHDGGDIEATSWRGVALGRSDSATSHRPAGYSRASRGGLRALA